MVHESPGSASEAVNLLDEPPDWGEAEHAVNEDDFHGTEELRRDLEQTVDVATARALQESLEEQELRQTLLPSFL